MQADEDTLKKIDELCRKYRETWGKEGDYAIMPNGIKDLCIKAWKIVVHTQI